MITTDTPSFILARKNLAAIIRYMIFTVGIPKDRVRMLFDQAMEDVEPETLKAEA